MNQKEISVLLTVNGETDVLIFQLDPESPEKYCINLNSATSQSEIRNVFSALLELLITDDFVLVLSIADGYTKALYKDVCSEYIDDLNREIIQAKELIQQELK